MRTRLLCAAALTVLFSASAAHAQYRGWQYTYGSGYGAGGYQAGYGVRPAGRPSYQHGGPSPFVWYSPHEGYSYDYQNGLPWRKNTSTGPIGRGGNSGVVRYSRPPQEANENYYVRSRVGEGNPNVPNQDLQAAVADQDDGRAKAPSKLPTGRAPTTSGGATRKASATKKPATVAYSRSNIRANGGGDWVPNVPSR
jgi:hypothetical protein